MKKVDIVVTKQNDVDVIRYELGAADVYDDKAADKAAGMPNVIPFQYSDEDGKRTITSYVKEKMTLEAMYKRTMNKKQVLSVLSGLVSIFEIGTQGIPVSYIIKEPSYIYVNEENLAVKCVLVAVKQDVMPLAEIPAFFRNVVSRIMYDDSDRDNYVAQLLTAINSNDFTVSKLKSIVDEQLEAMGLFISKENGLTDMPDRQPQAAQAPAQVKVNKLGVMNNIQNANRQMQSMPTMGQPMPQPGMSPMGQPMPQQPLQAGQPPMGPPMGPPMPQQPLQAGQPPMGQPMPQQPPQAGQPPMGQPHRNGRNATDGTADPQQPPQAGQPPMGQPQPKPAGIPDGQPMPQQHRRQDSCRWDSQCRNRQECHQWDSRRNRQECQPWGSQCRSNHRRQDSHQWDSQCRSNHCRQDSHQWGSQRRNRQECRQWDSRCRSNHRRQDSHRWKLHMVIL